MCEPNCKSHVNCKGELKKDNPRWLLDQTKMPSNLRPFIDHDYLKKLSPDELKWLHEFDDAYYNGKRNSVSNEWLPARFIEAYDRNSARRRDVYNHFFRTTNVDVFAKKHLSKPKNTKPEGV